MSTARSGGVERFVFIPNGRQAIMPIRTTFLATEIIVLVN